MSQSDRIPPEGFPKKKRKVNQDMLAIEFDQPGSSNIECVVAVIYQDGQLGVACFDVEDRAIHVGQTNESSTNCHATKYLLNHQLNQYSHKVVLVPSRGDFKFLNEVKKEVLQCETLPFADFEIYHAKQLIMLLQESLESRHLFMPDNELMIRACGALLSYLERNAIELGVFERGSAFGGIRELNLLKMSGFLQLDMDTVKALRIFRLEDHPCKLMNIGKAKEGCSLFGLLDRTKCSVGKDLLRQRFKEPLTDLLKIQERQSQVKYWLEPDIIDLVPDIQNHLKKVFNLKRIFHRMECSTASVNDWLHLVQSIKAMGGIVDLVIKEKLDVPFPICDLVTIYQEHELMAIPDLVEKHIHFQESKDESRIVIHRGIFEELDKYKEVYDNMDELLTDVAQEEISQLPQNFPYSIAVVYFPQLGYMVSVSSDQFNQSRLQNQDWDIHPSFEFHFQSGNSIFYKSELMKTMDEEYGDLHGVIVDTECGIVIKLIQDLLPQKEYLLKALVLVAELDALLSIAIVSHENEFTEPHLVPNSKQIIIRKGRNPIVERLLDGEYIPSDIEVTPRNRVNLLMGPNNSGKSVLLRLVGLMVFLSQIGSFVPAVYCELPIFDQIHTRMHSTESQSNTHSSFSLDLIQVRNMVAMSSKNSLLLMDEFGKGTLANDGISLLASILQHFVDLKENSPVVFATTHYTEILELVSGVKMYSMMTLKKDDDLVFCYRLTEDIKELGQYGIWCARKAGVKSTICDRAQDIVGSLKRGEGIGRSKQQQENDIEKDQLIHRFLMLNLEDTEKVQNFLAML